MSDGLLLVDKPAGWTSHDVVARVRRLAGTRRVGHAGTLDPMATGVLVLGVGRGTKLLTFLVGCDKAYAATIRLGQATVTDDAEGEVTGGGPVDGVRAEDLRAAVRRLTGEIEQVPSAVSAIKVDGRRSYARVRGGEQVELPARPVTIHRFDVLEARPGEVDGTAVLDVDVHVEVSSGTYVRALARDLGAALGCGGHLISLRRTRVGGFDLSRCHTVEALERAAAAGGLPLVALGAAARAALPVREVTDAQARALGYGQRLPSAQPGRPGPVAALAPDGVLVAVLDESQPTTRSLAVLAPAAG